MPNGSDVANQMLESGWTRSGEVEFSAQLRTWRDARELLAAAMLRPIDFCVTRKGVWDSDPSVCWCRSLPAIPSSGTPDAHARPWLSEISSPSTRNLSSGTYVGEESVDSSTRVVAQLEGRIDPVV